MLKMSGVNASRLPHPKPCRAQVNAHLDLPVHRLFVAHGVEAIVQVRQQAQTILRHKPVGLNARLVLVKPHIRVQARHAHVHAGHAFHVAGVALAKARLVQHVLGEFDHVNVVVGFAAAHGVVLGKYASTASGASAISYKNRSKLGAQ